MSKFGEPAWKTIYRLQGKCAECGERLRKMDRLYGVCPFCRNVKLRRDGEPYPPAEEERLPNHAKLLKVMKEEEKYPFLALEKRREENAPPSFIYDENEKLKRNDFFLDENEIEL